MLIFGILCICLSLDVFVCALEQGASIRNIRFSKALVYGLIFALCSSGMFLLGHGMSTYIFGRPLATLNKYVAIFVFLILGNGMIIYSGSLTLAHGQNSQMSFMYGFFFVKFLFFTVVCVVIMI